MGTINKPVRLAESIINGLIFTVARNAAVAKVTAAAPWLAYPGIRHIFKFLLDSFLEKYLADPLVNAVRDTIIDAQTNAQAQDWRDANAALQNAEQTGDQNAIDQATIRAREALARLIRSNSG